MAETGHVARPGLVVGIGNDLRRDDAVGRVVARAVGRARSDVDVLIVHQLLPELLDVVACYDRVVFVDAAIEGRAVDVHRVEPAGQPALGGHRLEPAALLGLLAICAMPSPTAWLVTVPAFDLGTGEGLSGTAARHVPAAVAAAASVLDGQCGARAAH